MKTHIPPILPFTRMHLYRRQDTNAIGCVCSLEQTKTKRPTIETHILHTLLTCPSNAPETRITFIISHVSRSKRNMVFTRAVSNAEYCHIHRNLRSLQCQGSGPDRGKAITLSFLPQESLQDWELWDLWFLSNKLHGCFLPSRERKREAGVRTTVSSCWRKP